MKSLILDLFGNYVPSTYEDVVVTSSGSITVDRIPDGVAGLDVVWLSGVLLFALTLYCVLKIVGGLLKNA